MTHTPHAFIHRLASLVPRPRKHTILYAGVHAPTFATFPLLFDLAERLEVTRDLVLDRLPRLRQRERRLLGEARSDTRRLHPLKRPG